MLLTVVDILHFYITWEISEQFSRRDLKPMPSTKILINYQVGLRLIITDWLSSLGDFKHKKTCFFAGNLLVGICENNTWLHNIRIKQTM